MILRCEKCGSTSVGPPYGGKFDSQVKITICEKCLNGELPDMKSYRKQENSFAEGNW